MTERAVTNEDIQDPSLLYRVYLETRDTSSILLAWIAVASVWSTTVSGREAHILMPPLPLQFHF